MDFNGDKPLFRQIKSLENNITHRGRNGEVNPTITSWQPLLVQHRCLLLTLKTSLKPPLPSRCNRRYRSFSVGWSLNLQNQTCFNHSDVSEVKYSTKNTQGRLNGLTASCPHYEFSSAPECADFWLAPDAPAPHWSLLLPANNQTDVASISNLVKQEQVTVGC